MFSPTKKQDKEFLLGLAEMIEVLVKVGTTQALDVAERFGDTYLELEQKLTTHDYETEDKKIEAFDSIFKQ